MNKLHEYIILFGRNCYATSKSCCQISKQTFKPGTLSKQMQEMRDAVIALQKTMNEMTKQGKQHWLNGFKKFASARVEDWRMAPSYPAQPTAEAYAQHQKFLEYVKKRKHSRGSNTFSTRILTAVTAEEALLGFQHLLSGLECAISGDLAEDVARRLGLVKP
ncbi:MAG: hypothetical protein H6976_14845 [Gammaproteobacteria bacterium]|nr:hypothetical protein [Gammaproteobacteria bacterium]